MKKGVAVVAYRCGALRVLEGCTAVGDYAFVGIHAKDQLVQLESPDEVQANLPFSGARLAADLAASLVDSKSFDIGLVPTGKWTTTRSHVDKAELEGGASCGDATHFVVGMTVGVAAMKMASEASDASGVFEAAEGKRTRAHACRGIGGPQAPGAALASPLELAAPAPSCAAPLVLHLDRLGAVDSRAHTEALTGPAQPNGLRPLAPACPVDLVSRAGKCAPRAAGIGHLCDPRDTKACRAQCEAGHLGSCHNLAASLCPKDEPLLEGCKGKAFQETLELSLQACEGGVPEACAGLAAFPEGAPEEEGSEPSSGLRPGRALELNEEACDAGSAAACRAAVTLLRGGESAPDGGPRRLRAALRGCKLGSLPACESALEDGDIALSVALSPRLCFGGKLEACRDGGDAILFGFGFGAPQPPGRRAADSPPAPPFGDVPRAMALYRHACAGIGGKKDIASCSRLAEIFLRGEGIPKDPAKAVSLYQQACEQADADEVAGPCLALGKLHAAGEGVARDTARAADLFQRACRGDGLAAGKACLERGLLVARGEAGKRDPVQAGELFQRGCEQAGLDECTGLADALAEGRGAAKDPEAAILVDQAACAIEMANRSRLEAPVSCLRAGDRITAHAGKKKDPRAAAAYAQAASFYADACDRNLDACFELAAMLRKGDKVKADPARARSVVADVVAQLQTSCDRGVAQNCAALAHRILRGDVPPKNVQRASTLFEKACQLSFEACNTFAEAVRWGRMGKRDYARAAVIYRKACDGGSIYGCGNLAALYEEGKAKPAAGEPGAAAIYRAGCDRDHKLSCLRLASMTARGDGVDRDEARAQALLEKVALPSVVARMTRCCEDSPDCCSAAGFACAHGLGTDKDPKRATELLRKGCDGGDSWGCARLKELPPAPKEAASPR